MAFNLNAADILVSDEVENKVGTIDGVVVAGVLFCTLIGAVAERGAAADDDAQVNPVNNVDGAQLGAGARAGFQCNPKRVMLKTAGPIRTNEPLFDENARPGFAGIRKALGATSTSSNQPITPIDNQVKSTWRQQLRVGANQPLQQEPLAQGGGRTKALEASVERIRRDVNELVFSLSREFREAGGPGYLIGSSHRDGLVRVKRSPSTLTSRRFTAPATTIR